MLPTKRRAKCPAKTVQTVQNNTSHSKRQLTTAGGNLLEKKTGGSRTEDKFQKHKEHPPLASLRVCK